MQLWILFSWAFAAIIYGYYFSDYYVSFKEGNYDEDFYANYFPSETKIVTSLIAGTVLSWTAWLFINMSSAQKTGSRQQHV
jgi:hypothetical protein